MSEYFLSLSHSASTLLTCFPQFISGARFSLELAGDKNFTMGKLNCVVIEKVHIESTRYANEGVGSGFFLSISSFFLSLLFSPTPH